MSGAARALPAVTGQEREFADVLSGFTLDGPAGRLAVLLDPAFLTGAGWHPVTRVLSPPAGHKLLGARCAGPAGAPPDLTPAAGCAAAASPASRQQACCPRRLPRRSICRPPLPVMRRAW